VQAATRPGAAAALAAPGMRMVMVVLVVSVLVAVAVWPAPRPAQKAPAAPPVQAKAEEREQIVITGQVLGEDDKPMAGARVAVVATGNGPAASRDVSGIGFHVFGQTTADAEGKFRLTVSRSSLGEVILLARK